MLKVFQSQKILKAISKTVNRHCFLNTLKNPISSRKGTYILILEMKNPAPLAVGRLGRVDFKTGWYAYVGSAMGPGGLSGRLGRYLNPVKTLYWHIDYFRQSAEVRQIWFREGISLVEHVWADVLGRRLEGTIPAVGFGSSDCNCRSHLFFFNKQPLLHQAQKLFNPEEKPDQAVYIACPPGRTESL